MYPKYFYRIWCLSKSISSWEFSNELILIVYERKGEREKKREKKEGEGGKRTREWKQEERGTGASAGFEPAAVTALPRRWSLRRRQGSPLVPRELCSSLELSSTWLTQGNSVATQRLWDARLFAISWWPRRKLNSHSTLYLAVEINSSKADQRTRARAHRR